MPASVTRVLVGPTGAGSRGGHSAKPRAAEGKEASRYCVCFITYTAPQKPDRETSSYHNKATATEINGAARHHSSLRLWYPRHLVTTLHSPLQTP